MRLAILLENQRLYSARYDEGTAELVTFSDERDHLGMHFRYDDEGQPQLVDCEDEANIRLEVRDDGMRFEVVGDTTASCVEDLLVQLFERVAETVGDVSTVVFVGAANPVLKNAVVRAGVGADIEYVERCEASIREWQWLAPKSGDAPDVVVLGFRGNGSLTWDYRVAAEDGSFIIPADAGVSNGQSFFPTAPDAGVQIGLERFFAWRQNHSGSQHMILSGTGTTTVESEASDLISGLRLGGHDVFCCVAVIGAARPGFPSRHARFDRAVVEALSSAYGLDFQTAMEKYETAKTVFSENPPEDLERLRLQIRSELMKAAVSPEASDTLYDKALSLSSGSNKEMAEVHAQRAEFYAKSGRVRRAEDELLAAYYMDSDTYADILSQEVSDADSHPKLRQLTNLTAMAKSEWRARADVQKTADTFLKRCKQRGIDIAPEVLKLKPVKSYTSGILHRINKHIQVIVIGPTDSGKDALTIRCFDENAASQLGEILMPDGSVQKVLEEENVPDKTRAVTRVVFGDGGLVLINTPGLYSDTAILPSDDEPVLSDMTRVLVDLEPEVEAIKEIAFINSEHSPAKYKLLPVEEVPVDLDTDIVLFLLNLAVMPLGRPSAELYRRDISQLRKRFGDRLIVVGSFLDALQKWSPEKQEQRREIWSWVLPKEIKMVEYSGLTGEGLENVIHELLRASNQDPDYLTPFLNQELKSTRLSYSLFSLAKLLASICDVDQREPYTDLIAGITVTCAVHLTAHYRVTEEEWASDGDIDISRIVADGGVEKSNVVQERAPNGWLERLGRWWSGRSYYEDVPVYTIGIKGLADVCALMYALIHEFEKVRSPLISEAEAWFVSELSAAGVASVLSEEDTSALQRSLSDVMLKFWREHHPEAIDLETRLTL